jgi:flagellar motor switch protein FliN/FliY
MWALGLKSAKPAWTSGAISLSQVKAVNVEIQVLLGRSILPMAQLLRMGRGAVIPLDAGVNDEVWILANNHPVARGEIQINDEKISIAVTGAANVYDFMAGSAG